ncbi:unnamed protein product [Caenorhabditis nigoni]
MKLSKYPSLVQKEILENMTYTDLFLLSFVSKNMKKLIKSSQTKRFKSIGRIAYSYDKIGEGMVYIPIKPIFRYTSRRTITETTKELILRTVERQDDAKNDSFQLNVAGKLIDFEIRDHDNCPVATFLSIDKVSAIESIHNYFLDFIGDSIEYYWLAENRKLFIPRLKNLSVCLRTYILDNVWDTLPSSLVLKQVIGWMKNPFKPESNFYQTESILLNLHNQALLAVLRYFQGRQAILTCSYSFEIEGWTDFVNRWKTGEAFQKLEYLDVLTSVGTESSQTEILNAIGVKRIDETKTPPSHTVPKICGWRYVRPRTDPIISHTYVVRETDNRVASILVRGLILKFGVWNETEEEFLALVK